MQHFIIDLFINFERLVSVSGSFSFLDFWLAGMTEDHGTWCRVCYSLDRLFIRREKYTRGKIVSKNKTVC